MGSTGSKNPMAEVADDRANPSLAEGKVIFACVANYDNKEVLAHVSSKWDQKPEVTRAIVEDNIVAGLKGDEQEQPPGCCAKYGATKIYYTSIAEQGISVVHVCTDDYKVSCSLQFQEEIAELWGDRGNRPDTSFDSVLREKVHGYTLSPPTSAKFAAVREKQDQVKLVLIDNIDEMMKRHGLIESNLEQTESLKDCSTQFAKGAKTVRKKAEWERCKMYGCIAAIVVVILAILVIVICVSIKC